MSEEKIDHIETRREGDWIFGKTEINGTYFGDWCRYTGTGVKIREDIDWDTLCAQNRIDLSDMLEASRQTPEYQAILKKWPLIK